MIENTNHEETKQKCVAVVTNNWRSNYTIPAENLYPHQWLWDSCFIAIGLRHIDIKNAQLEIRTLVKAQWSNGMIPHMIFGKTDKSSRDRKIWQSWRNPHAPTDLDTSGITQPPMLAEAVVKIGEKLSKTDRRSWYLDMYPHIIKYHKWLYNERDPHNEGLVLLIHPWESGLDNSPPWVTQLHEHGRPFWITIADKLKLDKAFLLLRRDTQHIPPGQRLNSIDALLYYSVMQRLRRKNWDIDAILSRSHFTLQDLTFNCILIRANENLQTIAKTIGKKLPDDLLENIAKTTNSIDQLWDENSSQYYSKLFITNKIIKEPSIATLMPLYAGTVTKEKAEKLVALLENSKFFRSKFPVASVPFSSSFYSEFGYWQGPTWVNTNWLIAEGLKRYGYLEHSKILINRTIELVNTNGAYEYFSAKTGDPAGAKNFSWTAALTIDMINNIS